LVDNIQEADRNQEAYLLNQKENNLVEFKTDIKKSLVLMGRFHADWALNRSELRNIVAMIKSYDAAFDQVVANAREVNHVRMEMASAFDAIYKALVESIKLPIEEKKNQALITGEEISPYYQELLSTTEKLISLLIEARLHEMNFHGDRNTKHADALVENLSKLKTAIEDWRYIVETMEEASFKEVAKILEAQMTVYNKETFDTLLQVIARNKQPIEEMYQIKEKIFHRIKTWKELTQQGIGASKDNARQTTLLLLVLGILFGIGITIFSTRSLSKMLKAITHVLQDIADGEGDLTKRLAVQRKDEIGHLAEAFNSFIEKIQGMVQAIAADIDTLNAASSSLSDLSGRLSGKSTDMSSMANTIATASEDMSGNMNTVAASMEQASNNLRTMASASEELTSTISEIAQSSENARSITAQAVSKSRLTSTRVHELGSAAQKIGMVTQTINEISDQTNLLALNATIEAARAGESGKGFAVVANEIKELAKQTAEATDEIKRQIQGIQSSTASNVTDIDEISEVINKVNDIVTTIAAAVDEQSATTKKIAGNVGETSEGIQDITQRVQESSTVSHGIYKDISEFNQAAREMSNMSGGMNTNAEDLTQLAEHLKAMVGKFQI
jgi:methyl-accepting chemotaxis protein